MNKAIQHISALLLAGVLVSTTAISSFAESTVYTVQDLAERAYTKDINHTILDRTLTSLWKQRNSALAGSKQVQAQLDLIERYKTLKSKPSSELSIAEIIELTQYRAIFGETPPVYTGQEMLDLFIKNRDFGHASILLEYKKLEAQLNLIKPTLEKAVYDLGLQYIETQENLKLQQSYLEIQKKQLSAQQAKLKLGQISKNQYDLAQLNYQSTAYQINSLENAVSLMKLSFNKLVGLDAKADLQIKDDYLISENYKLETVDAYLKKALENRSEVTTAAFELTTKQSQYETIKQYLSDKLLEDMLNYEKDYIVAQNNYLVAKDNVTEDIIDLYNALVQQDQVLKNQSKVYAVKLQNYKNSSLLFKQGKLSSSDFELLTYQYNTAYNQYKSENRKMGQLLKHMTYATGIGTSSGGN